MAPSRSAPLLMNRQLLAVIDAEPTPKTPCVAMAPPKAPAWGAMAVRRVPELPLLAV